MATEQTDVDLALHTCGDTSALHASTTDGLNLVSIGNLRVIVKNDGDRWSAQGLEIDYAVDGGSLDDVTREFAHGLALTLDENLRIFGHIRNVLKIAPPDVWNEFFEDALHEKLEVKHSQLSVHHIPVSVYVARAA